jgi:hypothetical protein
MGATICELFENPMELHNQENFLTLANTSRGMVYFAADEIYFQQHGIFLLRSSLRHNNDWFVHAHVYNPSQNTIAALTNLKNVSFSTETTDDTLFDKTADAIKKNPGKAKRICKTIKAHDRNRLCGVLSHLLEYYPSLSSLVPRRPLIDYLRKTYYSCQRFIILEELVKTGAIRGDIIALDADGLFNKALPADMPHRDCDIAIKHRESTGGQQFLAGSIFLPAKGRRNIFLKKLADELKLKFATHELEWGLDQFLLNNIVSMFHWENLNPALGDLDFSDDAIIWLAKGNSKCGIRYRAAQKVFGIDPTLSD